MLREAQKLTLAILLANSKTKGAHAPQKTETAYTSPTSILSNAYFERCHPHLRDSPAVSLATGQ
jgi:hypothetical protein